MIILISVLALLIIIIIILMFTVALKINFIFDTNEEDMKLTVLWLYPFLKAELFMQNKVPMLEVFLFHAKLFKKALKTKKKPAKGIHGMDLVRCLKLNDVNLTAKYGFQNKFMVGIVCGIVDFLSQFLRIDYFEQDADFMTDNDYIIIRVTANLNIMPTLKKLAFH